MMQRFSQQPPNLPSMDEKTREAFRVFDLDGNGYIDKNELRHVMKRLGENLSEDDVKEMFREADLNNDGKIDFNGNNLTHFKRVFFIIFKDSFFFFIEYVNFVNYQCVSVYTSFWYYLNDNIQFLPFTVNFLVIHFFIKLV